MYGHPEAAVSRDRGSFKLIPRDHAGFIGCDDLLSCSCNRLLIMELRGVLFVLSCTLMENVISKSEDHDISA